MPEKKVLRLTAAEYPTFKELWAKWGEYQNSTDPIKDFNDFYADKVYVDVDGNEFTVEVDSIHGYLAAGEGTVEDQIAYYSKLAEFNRLWLVMLANAYLKNEDFVNAEVVISQTLITFKRSGFEALANFYKSKKDYANYTLVSTEAGYLFGYKLGDDRTGGMIVNQPIYVADGGKKFDELLDSWLEKAWDLKPVTSNELKGINNLLNFACQWRSEYIPRLSRRWQQVQHELEQRKTTAIQKFNNSPENLTKDELVWVRDYVFYNQQYLSNPSKVSVIVKLLPNLHEYDFYTVVKVIKDQHKDIAKLILTPELIEQIGDEYGTGPLGHAVSNIASELSMAGRFGEALELFDYLIQIPDLPDYSVYNNALWAVQHDNNKLPLDPVRQRKYLDKCLHYGPFYPAIYYNAACIYFELGELEKVYESIRNAVKYGFQPLDNIKNEPLLAPIAKNPEFLAAFEPQSDGKNNSALNENNN